MAQDPKTTTATESNFMNSNLFTLKLYENEYPYFPINVCSVPNLKLKTTNLTSWTNVSKIHNKVIARQTKPAISKPKR